MNETEIVIEQLEAKATYYENSAIAIRKSIETIRSECMSELSISKKSTRSSTSQSRHKSAKKLTQKTKAKPIVNRSEKQSRSGSRQPFSKYKGVTKGYTKKDGSYDYMASVWRDSKNKMLGYFNIEEEAAAHAAKARGEIEQANKLFEIARQKGAVPKPPADTLQVQDRPKGSRGAKVSPQKEKTWKCNHCGQKYHMNTQPQKCVACDSASFKEDTE